MGGIGSGSQPDWKPRPGRQKRAAVAVCGTGVPTKPQGLSDAVSRVWDDLAAITAGVTFSQDAVALEEVASLIVRQRAIRKELDKTPADVELNRLSLAIGRQLLTALGRLGLTPMDRQRLLVPKEDATEQPAEGKSKYFRKGVKHGQ